jgi:DNA mismatch endonuclease (patch repair protein)
MADVHDRATRSYNMSRIKGKDSKPEVLVRKFLFSRGFRYKIHDKKLPGKPDIVLPRYKTAIFVDGCFWHGHEGCKYFVVPKTKTDWWLAKIAKTKIRDSRSRLELAEKKISVFTIFECQLRPDLRTQTLNALLRQLGHN